MIAELSLSTLLSIIWTVVFVMAVWAVAYWASRRPDAQSDLIGRMTARSIKRPKTSMAALPPASDPARTEMRNASMDRRSFELRSLRNFSQGTGLASLDPSSSKSFNWK